MKGEAKRTDLAIVIYPFFMDHKNVKLVSRKCNREYGIITPAACYPVATTSLPGIVILTIDLSSVAVCAAVIIQSCPSL